MNGDGRGDERGPVDPKRTTRQYSRVVGVAFLAFMVFVTIKALGGDGNAGAGLQAGESAPKFAAPLTSGNLAGESNVYQDTEQARRAGDETAACDVPPEGALRICDYFRRPLVLVVWSTKCGDCDRQVDLAQRAQSRTRRANFVAVATADSREQAAKRVRERGWTIPVAADPDGAVIALYNLVVPPATFFICPAGRGSARIQHSALGKLSQPAFDGGVERLVRACRKHRSARPLEGR
jgi:peroxiredoxin